MNEFYSLKNVYILLLLLHMCGFIHQNTRNSFLQENFMVNQLRNASFLP